MPIKISNNRFKDIVHSNLQDQFMRSSMSGAQDGLRLSRLKIINELGDWEEWRSHGEEIRKHVLENLDYYLNELSDNVEKLGGYVYFAETAEEANRYIEDVARKKKAKKVVKSKSMVTEEIGLNKHLEAIGIEVVETDLAEVILQMDNNDPPSHIITPALHKSKEDIRKIFMEKLNYTKTSDPTELARHVRETKRDDFFTADIGITGCNFAIAESGSVGIVTNEGNDRLTTTIPKTQITVMGMERIVPTFEEFEVLVTLLIRSAIGQNITSYVSVLSGPKRMEDVDGPEEFHLVIVDNGRSKILGTEFQSILHCIRCAACINVCPVYRHIGGQAYNSIYPGPIGIVLSPLLGGYDDFKDLPYASSLCGACSQACPVKIPLHQLIHKQRQVLVEELDEVPIQEEVLYKTFGLGGASNVLYTTSTKMISSLMKTFIKDKKYISKGFGPIKEWTSNRDFPIPKSERFRDWFENRERRIKE
ncbi:LutB/LldF family L-lactate oxidation iron-sulfur protein [Rummeliibacillus pycnus]|uniref:LutB/LldF family L-lactate oxidation iron-sulfur protein n=1 Tax=Rummeliibacillus pycnus TaxID=101070 RepID=UPI000C9BDBB5|nr:LutB/LldF family L-lactate oxidation iron-sulfur protein [Rummeliibacillus pycnus]